MSVGAEGEVVSGSRLLTTEGSFPGPGGCRISRLPASLNGLEFSSFLLLQSLWMIGVKFLLIGFLLAFLGCCCLLLKFRVLNLARKPFLCIGCALW